MTKTKKLGAPTKKTKAICDAICEGIAQGKSARGMCKEVGISQPTLWKWLAEDDTFSKQYARAKDLCADFYAEEIIEISDDSSDDWKMNKDGHYTIDNEAVQRSRLRVDSRKWYASKLAPKKYGERITNEVEGNPDKPINHSIQISFVAANPAK